MITYYPNIPNPPNDPSVDVPDMQRNTNAIPQFLEIDHVGFNTNSNPNGYHKIIHQVPENVDPVTIAGIGQIYSKNVTVNSVIDSQLFYKTALGGISQLTGNSASQNGYQWIGGMLLQWGIVNSTSSSGTVSLSAFPNIVFPNNLFILSFTAKYNSSVGTPGSQATYAPDTSPANATPISTTAFNWRLFTNSSDWRGFYWIAIGN